MSDMIPKLAPEDIADNSVPLIYPPFISLVNNGEIVNGISIKITTNEIPLPMWKRMLDCIDRRKNFTYTSIHFTNSEDCITVTLNDNLQKIDAVMVEIETSICTIEKMMPISMFRAMAIKSMSDAATFIRENSDMFKLDSGFYNYYSFNTYDGSKSVWCPLHNMKPFSDDHPLDDLVVEAEAIAHSWIPS